MKLRDTEIVAAIEAGELGFEPAVDAGRIGPVSVDLRLSDIFLTYRHANISYIDLSPDARVPSNPGPSLMEEVIIKKGDAFYLQAGEFALGSTIEQVTLPNYLAGWLDGRSTLARFGLMVHATAHTIEPGWSGTITLEFFNAGKVPIALTPGMRVCAISFDQLSGAVARPYATKPGAKYFGQRGPKGPVQD